MNVEVARGCVPGAVGRIVELNATYYHRHAGFDLVFEPQTARELADFLSRHDERRDGPWLALVDGRGEGSIAIDGLRAAGDGALLRWFIVSDRQRWKGGV